MAASTRDTKSKPLAVSEKLDVIKCGCLEYPSQQNHWRTRHSCEKGPWQNASMVRHRWECVKTFTHL